VLLRAGITSLLLVLPPLFVVERGMLFQKLKDYRKAVKEFAKAAKADPKNAQVRLALPCAVCLQHGTLCCVGVWTYLVDQTPCWWAAVFMLLVIISC
jgi:hypothetical protein